MAKINDLVTSGTLTKSDADVLQLIRTMGNEAAHEATPHPEDQLALAMDVVEHLLKSAYILPVKMAKFKKPPAPYATRPSCAGSQGRDGWWTEPPRPR